MIKGLHLLLTYTCLYECDHCFLHCGPGREGTFTLAQIRSLMEQAGELGTVEGIYYEGGEPFLFYPVMMEALRLAKESGFSTGVVTNAYFGTSEEDSRLWLEALAETDVDDLSMSDDAFHSGEGENTYVKCAHAAAEALGLPVRLIAIEQPKVEDSDSKGKVVGGGALLKGRAADKLSEGLPRRPWESLTRCPYEELEKPDRVHIDPFGHVMLCQGLSMGNCWERSLEEIVEAYDPQAHPIVGPLLRGGPAELARAHGAEHEDGYADECHMCYLVRRSLLDRFPEYLAPREVYGLS